MKLNKTMLAVAAFIGFVSSVNAQLIYGLNRGDRGGGIYAINTATGGSSLVYTTPSITPSGLGNGLAYDPAGGAFYYTGDGIEPKLFRRDANGEQSLGTLSGDVASATWLNGAYYYVPQGTNELHRVTFSGNTIDTDATTIMTGIPADGYGDIVFDPSGKTLYGASGSGFYRFNLGLNVGSILNSSTIVRQLGFDQGGNLYGVLTLSDEITKIDLTTGAATLQGALSNTSLEIQDAASAVPEPTTIAALSAGLAALAARRRRSR